MIHLRSKKLNLGCCWARREGYVNVDLHAYHGPDVTADALDLKDFPSGYYEEVMALGLIEHFKWCDTRRALYEWNRLLVAGGLLTLSTTYLNGIVRLLEEPNYRSVESQELLLTYLFAGQTGAGDYHLTAFSERLLRYYLWECGFDVEHLGVRDWWLFEVSARKARDYGFLDLIDHSPDDDTFLERAYREILFRKPDETDRQQHQRALEERRLTRRGLVTELLVCAERKQVMLARAPEFPCLYDRRPDPESVRVLASLAHKGKFLVRRLKQKLVG